MSLQDAFESLSEFLNSLDEEAEQQLELSHSLVIVCPDCGKNVAFRNRCPKCGGDSWIPAGHAGGIFERMKVHRWREQMGEEDLEPHERVVSGDGNGPQGAAAVSPAEDQPEETPAASDEAADETDREPEDEEDATSKPS